MPGGVIGTTDVVDTTPSLVGRVPMTVCRTSCLQFRTTCCMVPIRYTMTHSRVWTALQLHRTAIVFRPVWQERTKTYHTNAVVPRCLHQSSHRRESHDTKNTLSFLFFVTLVASFALLHLTKQTACQTQPQQTNQTVCLSCPCSTI